MTCFDLDLDPRELQYGRYASDILTLLREAVEHRLSQGATKKSIADELGWDRSQLSRLLNGRVKNLTARSVSDVLWATKFLPAPLSAVPYEEVSKNHGFVMLNMTGGSGKSLSLSGLHSFPLGVGSNVNASSNVGFKVRENA
jgi:transcriptional regulator with XRE-family HTH domain